MEEMRVSAEPFPPGEYIQQALETRGWTQDDLAEVMGRSRHTIMRLLHGQTAITPESAHELAKALETSPELWMNLQTAYELALAAKEDRDIVRRAEIYKKAPVREMRSRGWIKSTKDVDELEKDVFGLLDITSIDKKPQFSAAARKSTPYDIGETPEQIAWCKYAQRFAEKAPVAKYHGEDSFTDLVGSLHSLTAYAEDIRRVPRVLSDAGIRLVIVKHLQKTKIDGVAFWLDDSSPVIAMSLRYDRIDNFWFTLMHELSHVFHRHSSPVDVELGEPAPEASELPEIERQANGDACNWLIPSDKLQAFIIRKRRVYYEESIVQFAQARGVHPGIVVGLLHGRKELDFKFQRKHLAKVRSIIVGQALTDGWGSTPEIGD